MGVPSRAAASWAAWTISPRAGGTALRMPLGEIIFDFFDASLNRARGCSLDYEEAGEPRKPRWSRADILLRGEAVDAFSAIVHRRL